jgi:hypothetical protein
MFGKKAKSDSQFFLPKVKLRDCLEMRLPNINSRPMMRMDWVESELREGRDLTFWIEKIMGSQDSFKLTTNLEEVSAKVAIASNQIDGRYKPYERTESINIRNVDHLEPIARFGLLAGFYERASNTTNQERCHPLVVNAILTFCKSMPERPLDHDNEEKEPLLELTTCWAGYAFGKIPELSFKRAFSQWHN